MRMVALLMLIGASRLTWAEDAFGVWSVNSVRSTAPYSEIRTVGFEPHAKGEVFTLDRVDAHGRATTSSTILYFDGKPRDFQDSDCSGTQSSSRVDSRTVEILRHCAGGSRIRFVRRLTGKPQELLFDITGQEASGQPLERRLVLRKVGTAAVLAAQPVVVTGTGNPTVDVAAVQAAVDQGGQVVLRGHFSFKMPPTKPDGATYKRMVTVSKGVVISGGSNNHGKLPVIEGGFLPFYVEAPTAHVAIQGLRFVRPQGSAILIFAASGLVITRCRIEGVEASAEYGSDVGEKIGTLASAVFVGSSSTRPSAAQPGTPENFSGTLSIFNNHIEVGGTADDSTLGIVVFAVGKSPDKEVDLYISGNDITNITRRGINLYQIGGRVHIERNVIRTGAISNPSSGVTPDAIHVLGSGSYVIAHNSILSEWATGAGIRVQGNDGMSEAGAIVVDNDVTMPAPERTVFGANSAGIEIRGFARGNAVLNNRIRGRARAALAVVATRGRPGNNTLVANDLTGFQSSLADVLVDVGVINTVFVGRKATIEDHGVDTTVVPWLGKQ